MKSKSADQVASPTTVRDPYMWGGTTYPTYEGRLDGAAVAEPVASPAASTVPPAAAPTSPVGGVPGGSPTPVASPVAAPNPNDANIATLRTNYERLKPWESVAKLGKPEQIQAAYQRHQALESEATQLAEALGYTTESLQEAFAEDPFDVITHLRSEYKRQNPGHVDPKRIESMVNQGLKKAMGPIQEQINKQQTDTALGKLEQEFSRLISDKELGLGDDTPADIKDELYNLVDMMMPDSVMAEIKFEGKTSGVAAVFAEAKARLIKAVNSYNTWQASRAARNPGGNQGGRAAGGGQGNGNGAPPASSKLTLDQIMDSPETHLPGLKAGRY